VKAKIKQAIFMSLVALFAFSITQIIMGSSEELNTTSTDELTYESVLYTSNAGVVAANIRSFGGGGSNYQTILSIVRNNGAGDYLRFALLKYAEQNVPLFSLPEEGESLVYTEDSDYAYDYGDLSDVQEEEETVVELIDWSEMREIIPTDEDITLIDVRTGASFNVRATSIGRHADVEPSTQADTDIKFETRDGIWSWEARPIWVIIGERTFAASINGRPHAGSDISNNGVNGHFCLWFMGSGSTRSRSVSYKQDMLNTVMEAWHAHPNNVTAVDELQLSNSPNI